MPSRRRSPATRGCRWAWRRSPWPCGNRHLRHDPANPAWPDRDRFVVSNGHGSMLLYALLHLTGYDLPLDELKRFRQLHSKTPGHPEVGVTPGVETTTGPLGQGIANAVGMALAERLLAATFNRPGHAIVDHRTYVFLGDGCLMEGISHEACSLAGTWGLGKLVALYDDNGISIDGDVDGWFTDDTPRRFEAYGWNVIRDVDGHDVDAVDAAIEAAQRVDGPSDLDLLPDDHRQGRAEQGRQRRRARRGARRKGSRRDARRARLGARAVRDSRRDPRRSGTRASAVRALRADGTRASRPTEPPTRSSPPNSCAASRADCRQLGRHGHGDSSPRRRPRANRWPRARRRSRPSRPTPRRCRSSSAAPPTSPARSSRTGRASTPVTRNAAGQLPAFRRARIRDERDRQRRRAARRAHPLHRHVPHVLRLRAQRRADVGADEAAQHLRLHARLDRPRRGRSHPPVGRARGEPAPHSAISTSGGPATASRRRWPGLRPSSAATARPRCCSRGRTCRSSARDAGQIAAIRAGGYVLADWAIATGKRAVIIATGSEVALAMSARDALAAEGIAVRVVSMPCTRAFDRQDAGLARERVAARRARASPSRPARPMAGASTSARPTTRGPPSSVSIRSASRRPLACCSSISASRRRPSRQRYGAWWRDHTPFG